MFSLLSPLKSYITLIFIIVELQTSQTRVAKSLSGLEQCCCEKRQKSPGQDTGLGNRGCLKVLIDTKLLLDY